MPIFYGFSCSGSFTHQLPEDLRGLCDYDIWDFLQAEAPIRTEEGCKWRWSQSERNRARGELHLGRTEHRRPPAGEGPCRWHCIPGTWAGVPR